MLPLLATALFAVLSMLAPDRAVLPEPPASSEGEDSEPPADPVPATWRFRKASRPVKVMVLAGSVGAFKRNAYADWIGRQCNNVEVKNLSRTGYGAYKLRRHFRRQVLKNRRVHLRDERYDYWLVFHGGLNSVADPERTNHHIRSLFRTAHKEGVRVVGLSLTPWGDDHDRRRWAGTRGLSYRRSTQKVVDFVLGRSSPRDALGQYAARRVVEPDAPWQPDERSDVAVDLYDSALRDRDADPRPLDEMRRALERDRKWQRRHARLSAAEREAALERDAREAADIPRWYLRPQLRGFDHIHPNEHGHRVMFQTMCPALPKAWDCDCEVGE